MKQTADQAIAMLYTAAVDPGQWDAALAALIALANGRAANCFVHDVNTDEFLEYRFAGYGNHWARDYAAHYHSLDLARQVVLTQPSGQMYAMHRYVPNAAVDRSEYYQDFYIKEGLRYSCGGMKLEGNTRLILAVHRPVGHQPYEAETVAELQRVLDHLPGIFRVRNLAAQNERRALISGAALDALPRAVVIVDADLAIQYLNDAAKTLLQLVEDVRVRGNRLAPSSDRLAQQLAQRVRGVCSDHPVVDATPLYIPGSSGPRSLEIQVVPLPPRLAAGVGYPRPLAMLLLRQPFRGFKWPRAASRPFALSHAEMDVVSAIVEGLTPAEYAARRGVQVSTVRSQIKSILSKTGTRRIAELVVLFAAIDMPAAGT
jgi:DNA-binding CsgD family transcriptional regulator/PAS domain-containing protein